ncbi:MAG: DUF4185 domain-containing protein [Bacteroidetes bacterium]|nr:DUF4185 domain-containing protein [Bacteroidota bacterium]
MFKAFTLVLLIFVGACSENKSTATTDSGRQNTDLTKLNFTVEEAPEWSNIFNRTSGWFGGDGIFSIPQIGANKQTDSSETVLLFSDTMIGEIENDKPKPGYVMIHNSIATLHGTEPIGKNIEFSWAKNLKGAPESIFIPKTPASQAGEYYWLGDGFVNQEINDQTYIFGYRIRDVKGSSGFNFEHMGSTFIIIPKGCKPPYKDQKQIDIPFFALGKNEGETMSFGSGIFVNTAKANTPNPDGYVYVYGVRGTEKNLVVARVLPKDFEKFDKWKFWDGNNWEADMNQVANITNHVSNELSVTPLPDGRYALFFQVDGIKPMIGLRIGSSPAGPFGPIINVYDCRKALTAKKFFTYNAKAHPALSKPGEILISYNVNSFDFQNDIKVYPNLYRPRFIRVKLL